MSAISFKSLLITLFTLIIVHVSGQREAITYYLPDINYNESITTPEEYLGYQIGEWHISHDQLIGYLKQVASESDRVNMIETGRTHENRPLYILHISTPENLKNSEEIRNKHIDLTNVAISNEVDISDLPLVVYQGYSVHGNESSGVNAVPLVVYYLAAGNGDEVKDVLQNSYILLDPCYNPDGVQRFSSWVNSHKGMNLISDPQSREFNEMWPRGRTNHYWFDLNRDWLLLTHPESEARMQTFHSWKPNILTDHHEMGTNSTFFFQPGVPSRTNPNTPQLNQTLTEKIGEFHASALDEIGSQYFTKAQYDDFYYGKGSTYPDIHGCIGILFEQASSRGHIQESDNGILTFPFTIRNQVVTSLSTQRAGLNLREELLDFKRSFYRIKLDEAERNKIKAYSLMDKDRSKLARFAEILLQHDIEIYETVAKDEPELIVPMNQKQYGLIKTIFEKVTTFNDSIFYDVSAWTLPLAFDLNYKPLNSNEYSKYNVKKLTSTTAIKSGRYHGNNTNPYAWIFQWKEHESPRLLNKLLHNNIICKVTTKELDINNKSYGKGSILIPASSQVRPDNEIKSMLKEFAENYQLDIYELKSGYAAGGVTTGNPAIRKVEPPKAFTIVGSGVSSYDAGELWHYMDHQLDYPLTMIDTKDLNSADLSRYNTLVLTNGSYSTLTDKTNNKIDKWIKEGGNVIAMRGAVSFLSKLKIVNLKTVKSKDKADLHVVRQYQASRNRRGAKVLGGAIFNAEIDMSHPLAFGYSDKFIPLFRKGTRFYEETRNPYATPLKYTKDPLHSGYIPRGTEKKAGGAVAASTHSYGNGTVVCFSDNLLFRGYWWGTHKMFANAFFFTSLIDGNNLERAE